MLHLDEAAWRWRPLGDPKEAKFWNFEARSLTSLSDEYLFTQYFPSWVLQTQTRKGGVCLHIAVERGTCAGHMDKCLEMLKYKDCLIQKIPMEWLAKHKFIKGSHQESLWVLFK